MYKGSTEWQNKQSILAQRHQMVAVIRYERRSTKSIKILPSYTMPEEPAVTQGLVARSVQLARPEECLAFLGIQVLLPAQADIQGNQVDTAVIQE